MLPPRKSIKSRPITQLGINEFGRFLTAHNWYEILSTDDIDEKTRNFHNTIRSKYEEFFPEKSITVSPLDKPWMTPELKRINRKMKQEFWRNRKSPLWKTLKKKFLTVKKANCKRFYTRIFDEALNSSPSRWYSLVKKIGLQDVKSESINVECLNDILDEDAADCVAEHFARISQEYEPLNRNILPSFLPSLPPPTLHEHEIYNELRMMKRTKSVLPIDLPYKLRTEFAAELALPLTNIFNTCLQQGTYPKMWKFEWITPVPKLKNPITIKDLRKISCTSDFSKLFERFLRNWILEDIEPNLDPAQYGNQKGTGTDHMLISLVDKILSHLDNNLGSPGVLATMLDWSAAFDRQCPTLGIIKFMNLGVRPALLSVISSYLSNRSMSVKFNGSTSKTYHMPGGGPQGTLLGVLEYLVQCNDNADCVSTDCRFKYVDDLTILELLYLSNLSTGISSYNHKLHVASDIGIDNIFIPPTNLHTQICINTISDWTEQNKMMLNCEKSNYMLFTRSKSNFSTRLKLNSSNLQRVESMKLLGVWITENLDWETNTREICKKKLCPIIPTL